jgi:polar amino acid transport system substrate-binding protein
MLYVKTGKHEGSTAWAKTEQRKKDFIFSKKQIFLDKTVFIHLKNLKFNWRGNIVELQKFKLGTSLGYAYSTELENAFKNNLLKPDIGIDDLKSLRKLMLKRIDIFICGKDAALTLVRKYFSKKELQQFTKYIITPYKEIPIHLLLNKNQTKLKEEFDIGFKKLKESGRYQELITQIKKGEDYVN